MASDSAETFARPCVAAGVLFYDERGRVLMVVPTYKDYRDIPGGYLEHGETPTQAAAREVHEELGITPPIGRLLLTDWAPNHTEGDKLLFVFDGGILGPEYLANIQLPADELSAYEFYDPAQAHELTITRLAGRIVHGTEARNDGSTRYLEYGQPIGMPT